MADSELPDTDSSETITVFNPKCFIHLHRDLKKLAPWRLQQKIQECCKAFENGNLAPRLLDEGTGGTYLLRNTHGTGVGLFKPRDEEPYAQNNPKGFVGEPAMRHGVKPGDSSLREVAAFLLDRREGFVGIPQTAYAISSHPNYFVFDPVSTGDAKAGDHILQRRSVSCDGQKPLHSGVIKEGCFIEYAEHTDVASNLCASQFPVREVHKIGIFDIRTMNADRNDTNILVQKPKTALTYGHRRSSRAHSLDAAKSTGESAPFSSSLKLIPIDHAYILPQVAVPSVSWFEYCWLDWPQSRVPFDKETMNYIQSINVESDAAMLREELKDLPAECAHVLMVGTTFLQTGAAAGRTLYDIGNLMVRKDSETSSVLEHLVEEALTSIETSPWTNGKEAKSAFLNAFRTLAREYFGELSPVSKRFEVPKLDSSFYNRIVHPAPLSTSKPSTGSELPTPTLSTATEAYSLLSSDSLSLGSVGNGVTQPIPVSFTLPPYTSPEGSPGLDSVDFFTSTSVPKRTAVTINSPTPDARSEALSNGKRALRVGLFSTKDDGVHVATGMSRYDRVLGSNIAHSHSCHTCLSSLASFSPQDF